MFIFLLRLKKNPLAFLAYSKMFSCCTFDFSFTSRRWPYSYITWSKKFSPQFLKSGHHILSSTALFTLFICCGHNYCV